MNENILPDHTSLTLSDDRLIIAGSGNVALHIYRFAALLGYNISVIDNRAETLTRDRFPAATELLLGDVVELLQSCDITPDTSIVLATYHHEFDAVALQTVIGTQARYIGVLGNKHKVTAYYASLRFKGIDEDLIGKIHIPVGLDLGGQRAAEIALSVLAEIQAVKYGRTGGFLTIKLPVKEHEVHDELF